MADTVERLAAHWQQFADTSCGRYSPLYDSISRSVAGDDELLGVLLEAPIPGQQPVLVLAVVHYLLLGGLDHPLAAVSLTSRPTTSPTTMAPGPASWG